jgi:hypothetical protein
VVVDEVVAVDRDRPEFAGDRGLGAGAEPEPCAFELARVATQSKASSAIDAVMTRAPAGLTARTYPVGVAVSSWQMGHTDRLGMRLRGLAEPCLVRSQHVV